MTEEEKDKNINAFQRVKEKSEDDFEKNIVYITAGTLVLSLTFIEKIVNIKESNSLWVLVVSWSFLVITLVVNLLSHYLSSLFHDKSAEELDNDNPYLIDNIDSRNRIMRRFNLSSIVTLFIGISCLVIFSSINIYETKSNKKSIKNDYEIEVINQNFYNNPDSSINTKKTNHE